MFSGDSMAYNNGNLFTTTDRDNDGAPGNCVFAYGRGGWWYWFCTSANLNGVYHHSPRTTDGTGIWWVGWHGGQYSLKATSMMVQKT